MDLNLPKLLCDYGCGQQAKYFFKNGKKCCSKHSSMCPEIKNKISKKALTHSDEIRIRNTKIHKGKTPWNKGKKEIYNKDTIEKMSNVRKGKSYEEIFGRKKAKKLKDSKMGVRLTISKIKEKYPFFSKIEEMRYNPDKSNEKEIQVHCKNHECKHSKEKDGWFTPTRQQMKTRRDWLENEGTDLCYFYCSQKCKDECILYGLRSDPLKDTNLPYTANELQILNQFVMDRDNEICYYCGEHATIVHHLRPKKLEPFFALDPDYAIAVCKKCHYKYGHPKGSEHSTGNLAKIVCSTKS